MSRPSSEGNVGYWGFSLNRMKTSMLDSFYFWDPAIIFNCAAQCPVPYADPIVWRGLCFHRGLTSIQHMGVWGWGRGPHTYSYFYHWLKGPLHCKSNHHSWGMVNVELLPHGAIIPRLCCAHWILQRKLFSVDHLSYWGTTAATGLRPYSQLLCLIKKS